MSCCFAFIGSLSQAWLRRGRFHEKTTMETEGLSSDDDSASCMRQRRTECFLPCGDFVARMLTSASRRASLAYSPLRKGFESNRSLRKSFFCVQGTSKFYGSLRHSFNSKMWYESFCYVSIEEKWCQNRVKGSLSPLILSDWQVPMSHSIRDFLNQGHNLLCRSHRCTFLISFAFDFEGRSK